MDDEDLRFLEEIEHAPDDDDRRLIYADWLAERGDLRAEFLRMGIQLEESSKTSGVSHLVDALRALSQKINMPIGSENLNFRTSQLILFLERDGVGKPRGEKTAPLMALVSKNHATNAA